MSSSFPTQSECTRYEIFEYAHEPNRTSNQSDLDKIILLIFLYFLQGIPLGMTAAIPLILQAQANHPPDLPKRLAIFSMAMWPFALKFVFAPIIDSLKLPYLGLRKSWLFISQTGIAIALLVASASVRNAVLIFDIHTLLGLFLPLCLCAAIQDVAVDGWALALLSMPSWASTCNCVGQSAGFIFGTAAVTLIDWKYANNLFWWLGIAFICSTLILIIFKKEKTTACMNNITPVVAYKEMAEVIRLPSFSLVAAFHLTSRMSFAITDHVLGLQFIDRNIVARKSLPFLVLVIVTPIQILLPFVIGKIIVNLTRRNGSSFKTSSLRIYMWIYRPRLICSALLSTMAIFAGEGCQIGGQSCSDQLSNSTIFNSCNHLVTDSDRCIAFAAALFILFVAYKVFTVSMFVATMAFHAEISDTRLAGTCMTLANAVANLGAAWPEVIVLYLVSTDSISSNNYITSTMSTRFGVLSLICLIFGFVWYKVISENIIHRLGVTSWFLHGRKRQA